MTILILFLVFLIGGPWLLWGCYAVVMGLKRARLAGTLTKAQSVLGSPFLVIGYVLDFLVNVVHASAVFREWPREGTVSARLWRLSNGDDGWRKDRATRLRVELLDALDPEGVHRG